MYSDNDQVECLRPKILKFGWARRGFETGRGAQWVSAIFRNTVNQYFTSIYKISISYLETWTLKMTQN
jgi:hypothetical protein